MDTWVGKIGAIGSKPQSLFIVIPKRVCESCHLNQGDIAQFKFCGSSNIRYYPFLDGIRPKADKALKEGIEESGRKLHLLESHIDYAIKEAEYFLSILTTRQRNLTLRNSVIAVTLYVAGINLGARKTQMEISNVCNVTEVTIRNNLRKAWEWRNYPKMLRRKVNG